MRYVGEQVSEVADRLVVQFSNMIDVTQKEVLDLALLPLLQEITVGGHGANEVGQRHSRLILVVVVLQHQCDLSEKLSSLMERIERRLLQMIPIGVQLLLPQPFQIVLAELDRLVARCRACRSDAALVFLSYVPVIDTTQEKVRSNDVRLNVHEIEFEPCFCRVSIAFLVVHETAASEFLNPTYIFLVQSNDAGAVSSYLQNGHILRC